MQLLQKYEKKETNKQTYAIQMYRVALKICPELWTLKLLNWESHSHEMKNGYGKLQMTAKRIYKNGCILTAVTQMCVNLWVANYSLFFVSLNEGI